MFHQCEGSLQILDRLTTDETRSVLMGEVVCLLHAHS